MIVFPFPFGSRENFHSIRRTPAGSPVSNKDRRSKLYDAMARDLDDHGASFLNHGETSQSLSLSDIFALKDGSVTPVLKVKDLDFRLPELEIVEFSRLICE